MKKIIFFGCFAVFILAALICYQYYTFYDGRLHIVFCDVGQGDGILITTPNNKHVLIDAGPDSRIVDCLSKHLPFWERKIDIALLTHPHADHLIGYYYLVDRYSLSQFSTEHLKNKSSAFGQLIDLLQEKKIPQTYVVAGDTWRIGEVTMTIQGPSDAFLTAKNPDRFITNSAESASLIILVSYGQFQALLTGDAPVDEWKEIVVSNGDSLEVLQIPHHGSATGIDGEVLDVLSPQLAVISVGKDNHYGHPTQQTLGLLQERKIPILRTDQRGDIKFVSDGKVWKAL